MNTVGTTSSRCKRHTGGLTAAVQVSQSFSHLLGDAAGFEAVLAREALTDDGVIQVAVGKTHHHAVPGQASTGGALSELGTVVQRKELWMA